MNEKQGFSIALKHLPTPHWDTTTVIRVNKMPFRFELSILRNSVGWLPVKSFGVFKCMSGRCNKSFRILVNAKFPTTTKLYCSNKCRASDSYYRRLSDRLIGELLDSEARRKAALLN